MTDFNLLKELYSKDNRQNEGPETLGVSKEPHPCSCLWWHPCERCNTCLQHEAKRKDAWSYQKKLSATDQLQECHRTGVYYQIFGFQSEVTQLIILSSQYIQCKIEENDDYVQLTCGDPNNLNDNDNDTNAPPEEDLDVMVGSRQWPKLFEAVEMVHSDNPTFEQFRIKVNNFINYTRVGCVLLNHQNVRNIQLNAKDEVCIYGLNSPLGLRLTLHIYRLSSIVTSKSTMNPWLTGVNTQITCAAVHHSTVLLSTTVLSSRLRTAIFLVGFSSSSSVWPLRRLPLFWCSLMMLHLGYAHEKTSILTFSDCALDHIHHQKYFPYDPSFVALLLLRTTLNRVTTWQLTLLILTCFFVCRKCILMQATMTDSEQEHAHKLYCIYVVSHFFLSASCLLIAATQDIAVLFANMHVWWTPISKVLKWFRHLWVSKFRPTAPTT